MSFATTIKCGRHERGDFLESVRLLVQAGAKVNVKNKDGETAWDLASNEEIETLLANFGASVKKKTETKSWGDPR